MLFVSAHGTSCTPQALTSVARYAWTIISTAPTVLNTATSARSSRGLSAGFSPLPVHKRVPLRLVLVRLVSAAPSHELASTLSAGSSHVDSRLWRTFTPPPPPPQSVKDFRLGFSTPGGVSQHSWRASVMLAKRYYSCPRSSVRKQVLRGGAADAFVRTSY